MLDYLYDGTFEGFLTCIYDHYYEEKAAGIFSEKEYQANLLLPSKIIATDEKKAVTVYDAIEKRISKEDLKRIYRVFLSSEKDKETKLLRYVRLGFKMGATVSLLHSDTIVFDVQQCEKKVTAEMHRLLGLVRFSALSTGNENTEVLYSCIEPDHDILELIAGHFADRLKSDPFIIHDKTRGKAIFSQNGSWYISPFEVSDLPGYGEAEVTFRNLWKKYFDAIAIKERTNPACQKRCMPVRYWKNLTEFR